MTSYILFLSLYFLRFEFSKQKYKQEKWKHKKKTFPIDKLPKHFPFRCLDKTPGFFPPGRSIWCNKRNGPTARPTSPIGGHECCSKADFCNKHLKPTILDYRKSPVREYLQGGHMHTIPRLMICATLFETFLSTVPLSLNWTSINAFTASLTWFHRVFFFIN